MDKPTGEIEIWYILSVHHQKHKIIEMENHYYHRHYNVVGEKYCIRRRDVVVVVSTILAKRESLLPLKK